MIRIAILSFAHYHANFWAEEFRAQDGIELACVWDDDAARGQDAAARFGTRFEPDLGAALGACDGVAICSETRQHLMLCREAAAAGRAILCEKPTARNVAEVDAIAEAAAATGVLFMQSFPKRLDPASHALRRIVEEGTLGKIHTVRIRHGHFYGTAEDFRSRWYVRIGESGGGALLDEGVHGADFLRWLFGPPASVIATTSAATLGLEVEDNATAVFTWASGITAELTASFLFAAGSDSVELYGTTGTALLGGVDLASRDITEAPFLRVYAGGDRVWRAEDVVPRFKQGRFHHANAAAFAACLRDGAAPPATLADGRGALLMIERAYQAAATGARQEIGA
ncbi:Gfo/Idh/MocA family protein [Roseomonas sp. AR75]|uniref:Gfo/Idh/MocA family protein n=1 Tax=Roseomonas sp. AR75 TaxID=2562311 RepID=UPI0010C158FD|nr:Gfo/Idh/MocA family oxidoreductase [Roseomonas sp. AR75]